MIKKSFLLLILSLTSGQIHAASWIESVNGELSGNGNAPTPIAFGLGTNFVSGTMGRDLPQNPVDRDIFTFTISSGHRLTSIDFLVFEPTNQSFYALAPGSTINTDDPATHLANTLIKQTGDALPKLVLTQDSQGGGTWPSLPVQQRIIGPGTYTIWFQELSSVVTYQTAYTVEAVPEPSTWATLALGIGIGIRLLVRKRTMSNVIKSASYFK